MKKYDNELEDFSYVGENCYGLDFSNGFYKNGIFRKCYFRGSPFTNSTFINVVFDGCNLEDVDFSGSTFTASAIKENCKVNSDTDFSASFDTFSFNSSLETIAKRVSV